MLPPFTSGETAFGLTTIDVVVGAMRFVCRTRVVALELELLSILATSRAQNA